MNQPPYMDAAHSAPSSAPPMTHYSGYAQPQPMPSAHHPYSSSPITSYPQYQYANGMAPIHSGGHSASNSMSSQLVPQSQLPIPAVVNQNPPPGSGGQQFSAGSNFDQTGQVPPEGMKTRVTATLWEDEGSLCFQVEANGICVARREDNHYINGTKLLNVAGMTRGRRDGILKSEKERNVVKIGPMHLKGVWIPFERALDFANKEKITEKLYPLFVHNISALLYHPQNNGRPSMSGASMTATDRGRRADGQPDYMRTPQSSGPPTLQHHSSVSGSIGAHVPHPPHSIAPHPASGRPGLDRAHTFPTPPTSASSMMGMANSGGAYEWGGAPVSNVQTTQPLSIDTTLGNARSVPTTPASTPPGNSMQSMSAYPTTQPYERGHMYTSSASSQYSAQHGMPPRYGHLQPSPYIKSDMAPPARVGAESDHNGDVKPRDGYSHHPRDHPQSSDAEAEHEGDYTHSAGPYGQSRHPYSYNPNATPGSMHAEQSHVSPEMVGSPHHKGPGCATPRSAAAYPGYNTPQRAQQLPSSNLYNVMSDNRNAANGGNIYNQGYASQGYGAPNGGLAPNNKRVLEMDDNDDSGYGRDDTDGLKRRKTVREGSAGLDRGNMNRSRPMVAAQQKKR